MEKTVNERIAEIIHELRMNKKDFALSLGKDPSVIGNTVNGRNKPGYDVLEAILKTYPQISSEWLMKGEGEMFKDVSEHTSTAQSSLSQSLQWANKMIAQQEREINRLWQIIEKDKLGKLRVPSPKQHLRPIKRFLLLSRKFGCTNLVH